MSGHEQLSEGLGTDSQAVSKYWDFSPLLTEYPCHLAFGFSTLPSQDYDNCFFTSSIDDSVFMIIYVITAKHLHRGFS